ncbi:hypothetical protein [Bordetella avium]|uniref:hypothetical protein n=1 Tax=Bordetella avium TaxID=521 RepID=UPI001F171EEF|nr:hypothetical protein [Bordetella avium]
MDDQRHLWPYWFHLIEQCRPAVVFGEQVEAAIRYGWLDLVQSDMEGIHYAFAATGIPAAGVGAPHIRQRIFFVGDANHQGLEGFAGHDGPARRQGQDRPTAQASVSGGVADNKGERRDGRQDTAGAARRSSIETSGGLGSLEHTSSIGRNGRKAPPPGHHDDGQASDRAEGEHGFGESGPHRVHQHAPGPVNGFWANADWLLCRDGKWRPVEPGTFPLAHGATARVGRLRAYGNAICAPLAAEFVSAYLECRP